MFGDKAVIERINRQATCLAASDKVKCLLYPNWDFLVKVDPMTLKTFRE
jgi:hypothetical protein